MEDISLHILDIAENSINAGAGRIEITVKYDTKADSVRIKVDDDGKGIDTKKLSDPYFTCKTGKRFGLGIPLLAQAARECNGSLSVERREPKGTTLRFECRLSHIDLKPLGNMGSTMATLVCGHPEIDYSLSFEKDAASFLFDTRLLKKELVGVPLNNPQVLKYIKDEINDGIRRVRDEG